jgi:List-Bact-rpt repeat protein
MSRSSRRGRVASIFAFAYLLSARASLGQAGPDSLALSSGTADSNGTVALNLVLTSPPGSEPSAIQWTLTYPPANVVSISVSSGAALTGASKTLSCSASSGTYTCVASGLNAGIISNGAVAVVNLIMAAGPTTTPIAIGNNVASSPAGIAIPFSATGGTVMASLAGITGITIQTNPAGLQFTVDGGAAQTAPQTLNLTQGTHTIAVPATQAGSPLGPVGTQYVFTGWSDGGAASHSIVVAGSEVTYTATFAVQYLLTTAVSPAGAGSVMASPSSAGGYYNQGTSVQLTASASAGFQFISWGGELSGSANPQSITMNAAYSVTVNFSAPSCTPAAAGLPATVVACPTNFGGQIGVFRPPAPVGGALGFFTLNESGTYTFTGSPSDLTTQFGLAGDYPVAGDWDGTGIIRIGVFRCPPPGTGVCSWYLDQNNNGVWDGTFGDITFQFGLPGDIPVVGDWGGTGVSKVGVMRCPAVGQPGVCTWILDVQNVRSPNSSTFLVDSYGLAGDQPAVGGWSNTISAFSSHPVDQIGVFRCPTTGVCLWILNSSGSGFWAPSDTQYSYGLPGDLPVTGDWQEASTKRIGVFRCPAGAPGSAVCQWILNTNGSGAFSDTDLITSYGLVGDMPVVGFWTIP